MSSLRRLRKQLVEDLDGFPIPQPFSIPALIRAMEGQLDRRILLRPMPPELTAPGSACGLRVKMANGASLVLFPLRSTQYHQEHVILHELVHEWFDHGGTISPVEFQRMTPHVGTNLIRRFTRDIPIAARTTYESEQELATEVCANIIRDLAARQNRATDDLVGRLEASLSHPFARRKRRKNQ
ncbi:toxin [Streptomyces sp. BH-SS-21]|uniref:Toxin n=1 Tax=Streptomyces liliiviolaceus TaxID=2823109 RepID=A0A940Y6F2_9ACTN|nr:toxin [Streptomyces liliiviolaceus]MBQ0855423.1 toxin [Streptomyces liliiviolaceus]